MGVRYSIAGRFLPPYTLLYSLKKARHWSFQSGFLTFKLLSHLRCDFVTSEMAYITQLLLVELIIKHLIPYSKFSTVANKSDLNFFVLEMLFKIWFRNLGENKKGWIHSVTVMTYISYNSVKFKISFLVFFLRWVCCRFFIKFTR